MLGGDWNINNLGVVLTNPKQTQNRLFFMILKKWSAAGGWRSDMIEQLLFFKLFFSKSAWISIFREMKNPWRHFFCDTFTRSGSVIFLWCKIGIIHRIEGTCTHCIRWIITHISTLKRYQIWICWKNMRYFDTFLCTKAWELACKNFFGPDIFGGP